MFFVSAAVDILSADLTAHFFRDGLKVGSRQSVTSVFGELGPAQHLRDLLPCCQTRVTFLEIRELKMTKRVVSFAVCCLL